MDLAQKQKKTNNAAEKAKTKNKEQAQVKTIEVEAPTGTIVKEATNENSEESTP